MFALGALQPIGNSPILISIQVLIPLINNMMTADRCRTVVVYSHNDTSDIATEVLRTIDPFRAPVISVNVDKPGYVPPDDLELGFYLFNLCILRSVRSGPRQERMLRLLDIHAKNAQFIIFLEKATDDEIREFFTLLWTKYKMVKVAAFFLGESVQVYTHFPYENRFGVKMDELQASNASLPANAFAKYFFGKTNYLQNAKLNVYMSENFPKTFQTPARYRYTQTNFYFAGRDGLTVQNAQLAFNVRWKYRSLPPHLVSKISPFDFGNDSQGTTDDVDPDNLDYVDLQEGDPIS